MATISGERAWRRSASIEATDAGERSEYRFRQAAAWVLWYLNFQAILGLGWDIRWHATFGRDSFWSPPHLLMYSGIALAGFLCIGVVLVDTWRYRRGVPGVREATTWPIFGFFRAPLGFAVMGCGLAVLLFAAPFDDWWHQLYGLDVTLWAPFHVMGLIGACIAGAGLLYIFAALGARARRLGLNRRRVLGFSGPDWAKLLTLSGLLTLLITATQPATTIAPTLVIGPVHVLLFPVLLCAFFVPVLIVAVRVTERPGAATLVMALFFARQVFIAQFVPWALRAVHDLDPSYDYCNGEPRFILPLVIAPLALLPAAFLLDLLVYRQSSRGSVARPFAGRTWLGSVLVVALPLIAVAPLLVRGARAGARGQLPPGLTIPDLALLPAFLVAVPVALVVAALSVRVGDDWGAILRLNDR
jgi:hypothetical protein